MIKKFLNNNGFSLIECVVVVVIISIVVLIWGFYGSDHMKIAYMNEGHMLVEKVVAQERLYMAKNSAFLTVPTGTSSTALNIDTKQNNYFKTFKTTVAGNVLIVEAYGSGKAGSATVRGVYDVTKTTGTVFHEFF